MTEAMLVYNVYMTLVSFVMFAGILHEVIALDTWRWWNVRDTSPKGSWLAYLLWGEWLATERPKCCARRRGCELGRLARRSRVTLPRKSSRKCLLRVPRLRVVPLLRRSPAGDSDPQVACSRAAVILVCCVASRLCMILLIFVRCFSFAREVLHCHPCDSVLTTIPCNLPPHAVNFVTKPTEFVDTYFMLVKGNYRQVTWLHISHHAVMPINMTILLQMVGYCAAGRAGLHPRYQAAVGVN